MKIKVITSISIMIMVLCMIGGMAGPAAAEQKALKSEVKQETHKTININSASIKELSALFGIGKKKAEAIIAYRTKNGKFRNVAELSKVEGIGKKTLSNIRKDIVVE